ncbi:hypothetical protein QAD02_007193 [Eretmocerus hayati]|uniref:Uncharacterized protein n=1 Tax=Eretmocerus hayati TaxID=131215 RepID=A0ACC2N4B4_9HYME|nr:hypothetical protein QAD02_007193 [Eretmocerus hayati]
MHEGSQYLYILVPGVRKFKYQERTLYIHRYQVSIWTSLSENQPSHNESMLLVNADVIINFISPCEGMLRFQNVTVSHDQLRYQSEFPDNASAGLDGALEGNALRFVFNDGEIRELCPTRDDTSWVLNFRRGFLSMFQNTMLRFDIDRKHHELDVNGEHATSYDFVDIFLFDLMNIMSARFM